MSDRLTIPANCLKAMNPVVPTPTGTLITTHIKEWNDQSGNGSGIFDMHLFYKWDTSGKEVQKGKSVEIFTRFKSVFTFPYDMSHGFEVITPVLFWTVGNYVNHAKDIEWVISNWTLRKEIQARVYVYEDTTLCSWARETAHGDFGIGLQGGDLRDLKPSENTNTTKSPSTEVSKSFKKGDQIKIIVTVDPFLKVMLDDYDADARLQAQGEILSAILRPLTREDLEKRDTIVADPISSPRNSLEDI